MEEERETETEVETETQKQRETQRETASIREQDICIRVSVSLNGFSAVVHLSGDSESYMEKEATHIECQ